MENLVKNLEIVYEDNHIIVVVKPVGIPTQGDKTGDISLLDIVKAYIKEKYSKPGEVYLGLLHRLDRMVGGLIVFAKTSKAASRISENIRNRDFKKKYIAILNGKFDNNDTKKTYVLKDFLLKDERKNMSFVVSPKTKDSKESVLEYMILKDFKYLNKEYTLVDVNLHTGRHHQIRVQFSNIGMPLYGDIKYGEKINKVGQKLALWAYYLKFFHPTKDEVMEFYLKPKKEYVKSGTIDKVWEELI